MDEPGYRYVTIFGGLYGFDEDTVYLSPAPVYHAAPLRFGGVVHATGGTLVMMERFDAEGLLGAVERYRVTHTQMVPTMFVRLLKLDAQVRGGYDVSSLRCVVHAAAPCPVDVKRAMIDWLGPIIHEYYASTESNGATMIDSEQWLAHPGSVGLPLIGVPHVCDETGAVLPPGEVGTLYFEREELDGPSFAYHKDPEKTASTQHPEHPSWTTVGDLGYLDEEGYLYLTDRAAFMIISGGVNIYPQEIEDAFTLHPQVLDIGVVGMPDDEMGSGSSPSSRWPRAASPAKPCASSWWRTPAPTWRATRCPGSSSSSSSCRAPRPARWSSASCAPPTPGPPDRARRPSDIDPPVGVPARRARPGCRSVTSRT